MVQNPRILCPPTGGTRGVGPNLPAEAGALSFSRVELFNLRPVHNTSFFGRMRFRRLSWSMIRSFIIYNSRIPVRFIVFARTSPLWFSPLGVPRSKSPCVRNQTAWSAYTALGASRPVRRRGWVRQCAGRPGRWCWCWRR